MRRTSPLYMLCLAALSFALTATLQPAADATTGTLAATTTALQWNIFTDKNGLPGTAYAAAVTSTSGTPTGTVTFFEGATNLGTGTLGPLNGMNATDVIGPPLAPGSHTITAVYNGDGNFATSSTMVTQTIPGASTSATIASSINPSPIGGSVTFTASLFGQPGMPLPTGNMVFAEGTTVIGTVPLVPSGDHDTATFSTSTLSAGLHAIVAGYAGDTLYGATVSAPVAQAVEPASVTTVTSSLNPSMAGSPVTFTASVAAVAGGTAGTGSVAFAIDGTTVITTGLNPAGMATFTTSALTLGTHPVSVTYLGSTSLAQSTSPTLNQVVNAGPTAALVVSAPSTVTAGSPFSVTVSAVDAFGNAANTYLGTVHFSASGAGSLPADYTFTVADNGAHVFVNAFSLSGAGTDTITATDTTTASITGTSAPINVHATSPSITGFSPASGQVGSIVTITGSGFNGVTTVSFGGIFTSFSINSDTQISAIVPDSGSGVITVTSPAGSATSTSAFTVTAAPTITSISPNNAVAGSAGFSLTVNGTNFVNGAMVNLNGAARTTTFISSSQLSASILASDITTAGTSATVTVVNPDNSVSNSAILVVGAVTWIPSVTVTRPGDLVATFTLKNTGTADASNVQVTAATLGAYGTTTTVPTSAVNVTVGNTTSIDLHFPASVGAPGARVNITVKFTYNNGATSSFSMRGVTLP